MDNSNIVHYLSDELNVSFTGINNIKMILYKDRILKNKIDVDRFNKLYITYRNSDKA